MTEPKSALGGLDDEDLAKAFLKAVIKMHEEFCKTSSANLPGETIFEKLGNKHRYSKLNKSLIYLENIFSLHEIRAHLSGLLDKEHLDKFLKGFMDGAKKYSEDGFRAYLTYSCKLAIARKEEAERMKEAERKKEAERMKEAEEEERAIARKKEEERAIAMKKEAERMKEAEEEERAIARKKEEERAIAMKKEAELAMKKEAELARKKEAELALKKMKEDLDELLVSQMEFVKQLRELPDLIESSRKALYDHLSAMVEKEVAKEVAAMYPVIEMPLPLINMLVIESSFKALCDHLSAVVEEEVATIVAALAREITPTIEGAIRSAITETFQREVVDKAVNQLTSELEETLARQVQQAVQEALSSVLESSVIPSMEGSFKIMFEQLDFSTFQKAFQKEIVAGGSNGGHLSAPLEKVEDPRAELTSLLQKGKYQEAFDSALGRRDVTIVCWLCSQMDVCGHYSMSQLPPLSQDVLLSLLQQLAHVDTSRKLRWMTGVVAAINPVVHRLGLGECVLNQVLDLLNKTLNSTPGSDVSIIQAIIQAIKSKLSSCK